MGSSDLHQLGNHSDPVLQFTKSDRNWLNLTLHWPNLLT